MNNRAPKIVLHRICFYEHFIQMPLPIGMSLRLLNPLSSDLRGKLRAKTVPPEPRRFVTDIEATFVQPIIDIAK
jgi:hypothetical protein